MKILPIFVLTLWLFNLSAQSSKQVIYSCFKKFDLINSYKAKVHLDFDLPNIQMKSRDAKVYYKKPNKFKIKSSGILFLPKQNPFESYELLKDSSSYTAVYVNEELVQDKKCKIILVVPTKENDIILCKLWIEDKNSLIYKIQMTTKSNGTILADYYYELHSKVGLPDKTFYEIEMGKFKLPRALSVDLNVKKKKSTAISKNTGTIKMSFSDYEINIPVTEI
ncbi:MAG: hypothetical protein ABIO44_10135 [Saprospiraceae bacterium]